MGADIHSFAEVKRDNKWLKVEQPVFPTYDNEKTTEPFGYRNYGVFGFLADVRNYSHCTPIGPLKGLPNDSEFLNTPLNEPEEYSYGGYSNGTATTNKERVECDNDYHSKSWLTLKELLDFDYEKKFWDRRVLKQLDGAALAEEGEGQTITYREHLGKSFFKDIEALRLLGQPENVRIVYWFDN